MKEILKTTIKYTCDNITVECDLAKEEECRGTNVWAEHYRIWGLRWLNNYLAKLHICIPKFCKLDSRVQLSNLLHEQTHYANSEDVDNKKLTTFDEPLRAQNLEWVIPAVAKLPKSGTIRFTR